MSSSAFNYFALLAALVVGYGVFVSADNSGSGAVEPKAVLQGYYLRDAVITETATSGNPRLRVAATEAQQNLADNSVLLTGLRIDYLKPQENVSDAAAPVAHWVLSSDRGTAFENFRKLELRDNVRAHNLGAPHAIILDTAALDIDAIAQTAHSNDDVAVAIDADVARGRGLSVDMNRERIRLASNVSIRLAQTQSPESAPKSDDSAPINISLPDTFDSQSLEYRDNVWTLTKVRSKSPPFIEADTLRATGTDLADNKVVMHGSVRLELPKQGELSADIAIVTIRNNRVASVHVESESPAKLVEFQHRRKDSDQLVHGKAQVIDYDVGQSTLRLIGNVSFSDEQGDWTADTLDYNIATEALRGTNNTIKINPRRTESSLGIPSGTSDKGREKALDKGLDQKP